jgi:hypothetical protein
MTAGQGIGSGQIDRPVSGGTGGSRRARLARLGSLFRSSGRVPDDPFVFLTNESLMRGLPAYMSAEMYAELVVDVACHVHEFKQLNWLRTRQRPNGEVFLAALAPCLNAGDQLDLTASGLGYQNLPAELQRPVRLRPLVALNVAGVSADGMADDRFYLMWTHTSNQTTDVAMLLLDLETGVAHLQPSLPSMAFTDLYTIFKFSVPQNCWPRAEARASWLRSLSPAEGLALVPHPCPTHFGHYVQNNLCHLSRLEELGVASHCKTIYRPGPYDYFNEEEEQAFFRPTTRPLLVPVPSLEAAKQMAKEQCQMLISSKGATLSNHLARCLQQSLSRSPGGDVYRLCVGVRGGSREALNLIEVMELVLQGLLERQPKPVHLVVDGMSQSRLNSMDTTRYLSLDREEELATALEQLTGRYPRLTVQSVVNRPMFEQMAAIARCNATISHFGSSFFKYMVMAGRPVIVHGDRPAFADKYDDEPPANYFLGPDYVAAFGAGPDPKRACYELNVDKVVPAMLEILLKH